MPSLVFNNALLDAWTGDLDLEEGQNDIRVALLMTNTDADTPRSRIRRTRSNARSAT